jgi:hypothetical protein
MDEARVSQKKNIIIAYPAPKFGEALKRHFEAGALNVLEVVVVIDHLFEKLEQLKSDGIHLHGLVVSSTLATKLKDKRLEFLSDSIQKIREDFSDTSLIFLSGEKDNHPLHAELVAMGVYNIFVRSSSTDQLDVNQLIKCIDTPMPYGHTAKFRDYDKSIPWRRFIAGAQSINVTVESKSREDLVRSQPPPQQKPLEKEQAKTAPQKVDSESNTPKKNNEKIEKPQNHSKEVENKSNPIHDIMEDELDEWQLTPIKPRVIVRDRIIGKAIIAVTGIENGSGKTHAAVAISNYLASNGYHVKLIECDDRKEYANIERSYEGKNADPARTAEFEINGVTYVKSGSNFDMAYHLASDHTHIVLDVGCYDSAEYIEEFHRANYLLIVASGSEWKQPLLQQFIKTNKTIDQSKWKFLIPLIEKQTLSDIRSTLDNTEVFGLPYHPDPFKAQGNTDNVLGNLFGTGFNGRRKKIAIIATGTVFLALVIFATWFSLK